MLNYPDLPNHESWLPNLAKANTLLGTFRTTMDQTPDLNLDEAIAKLKADLDEAYSCRTLTCNSWVRSNCVPGRRPWDGVQDSLRSHYVRCHPNEPRHARHPAGSPPTPAGSGCMDTCSCCPGSSGSFAFQLMPILFTIFLSFTDYTGSSEFKLGNFNFVGMENFKHLFMDPLALPSMGVTLKFALIGIPLGLIVPLLLASAGE